MEKKFTIFLPTTTTTTSTTTPTSSSSSSSSTETTANTSATVQHASSIATEKETEMEKKRSQLNALHYLPCHIQWSGSAPISTFFNFFQPKKEIESQEEENEEKELSHFYQSHFRGRELMGTFHTLDLYQG
ncbi:hypothetical protein HMI54_009284, partial [Coelomomyces lativittatus]